jgi:16S rRNA (guanine527-N7)-methyltransferase
VSGRQRSPTAHAQVQALCERYGLADPAQRQLELLLALLVDDPAAPTTVRAPRAVIDDHLSDSLVAVELPELRRARTIADIGSGAGLPALPLAIALPVAAVTAVESNMRKSAFIARAAERCDISNVTVVTARAEAWPEAKERCDVVTARALAPLDVLAEYAAPLLRIGGTLVAWRGRRDPDAEAAAARAAGRLGLEIGEIHPVRPYPKAEHRHLHVLVKVAPTPPGFPRRPGIARKRPLGHLAGSSPDTPRPPSDRDRR